MINWPAIFDSLHVEWRDRGKNTSRGNVNIACPFCRDDPSFHLSVSLDGKGFYCYRNPNQHSGSNALFLLSKLGASKAEASALLSANSRITDAVFDSKPVASTDSAVPAAWERFAFASDSSRCCDYLEDRGFPDPVLLTSIYDLRYAPLGRWSGRLLIPFYHGKSVLAWTGRGLTPSIEPKYLTHAPDSTSPLFVPKLSQLPTEIGIVVEGPIDALKVTDAGRGYGFSAVALAGKALTPSKLLQLSDYFSRCKRAYLALDSDVPFVQVLQIIRELKDLAPLRTLNRLPLPPGYKDPGEMSYEDIRAWLK